MDKKLDYIAAAPEGMNLLFKQEEFLGVQFSRGKQITKIMWELIKLRVSQINSCAFCINMHFNQAIEMGESNSRLMLLNGWKDAPCYSQLERKALDYAEQLTANNDLADSYMIDLRKSFGDSEVVILTIAINAINAWNRVARSFKPNLENF